MVHEARQEENGRALRLLRKGAVDPRRTVFLEKRAPTMQSVADPSADTARVEVYEPERIRVRVGTATPGMLVMSEVYYPAWRAYVDGERTEVYAANHAMRAVAVPAGEHTVEFRFESSPLRIGMLISVGMGAIIAVGIAMALAWPIHRADQVG